MTSSSVNAPTEMLSNNIYFDAFQSDKVAIKCNACISEPTVFFEGNDWEHLEVDWLALAINHLIEVHPQLFEK